MRRIRPASNAARTRPGLFLLSVWMTVFAGASNAADAFTVRAWAGFPKEVSRKGEYTLMFKGHRNREHPKVQYSLSIRFGYPEFKFMDAEGKWDGIMMNADIALHGGNTVIPVAQCPSVRDDRAWHHLAGVFDRGSATLYFDGKPVIRVPRVRCPPDNEFEPRIGSGEGEGGRTNWRFPGEVRYHKYEARALSGEEIAALYAKEAKLLAGTRPKYSPFVFPEIPCTGELPRTKAYFDSLPALRPRGSNCVAKVRKVNGIPRLFVDGKPLSGMGMMPSPHVSDEEVTFACRDFSACGVRLFSNIWWGLSSENKWWLGEGKYDFDYFDRRMMAMIRASPEGWVFPRIKMDPPPWWAKAHPEELYCRDVRADSVPWRRLRERMLRDVVAHVEGSSYAAHVIGYHIGAQGGSEWLVFGIPEKDIPNTAAERLAWLDARSKATADALLDSARLIKELTHGNKIVGSFFGYFNDGHRDFARAVASPYLDFFCAPDAYFSRRGGEPGKSQVAAQASCRLHNKIFWIEADERTLYAKADVVYRCETLKESIEVAKRTIGYTLTEGWETWWFLLQGNMTFHDEALLAPIARGAAVAAEALESAPPRTEADVCVFRRAQELECGPRAFPKPANSLLYGMNLYTLDLPRCGVAYDVYVFEDVLSPELPDYKVYVFPEAKTMTDAERSAVERLTRRKGKTSVWFNAERDEVVESPEGWRQVNLRQPPKFREIGRMFAEAGAHVWVGGGDIVCAGRGFLMVHAATSGEKRINLPRRADVTEIYGLAASRKNVLSFEERLNEGETRIYRLRYR